MEEVDSVHREYDHATIEHVEIEFRADNVAIPANAKLCRPSGITKRRLVIVKLYLCCSIDSSYE